MTTELHKLDAIAEHLQSYLDGDTIKPPSEETLRTFQNAYIRETKLQRNTNLSSYSELLDNVIAKINEG